MYFYIKNKKSIWCVIINNRDSDFKKDMSLLPKKEDENVYKFIFSDLTCLGSDDETPGYFPSYIKGYAGSISCEDPASDLTIVEEGEECFRIKDMDGIILF